MLGDCSPGQSEKNQRAGGKERGRGAIKSLSNQDSSQVLALPTRTPPPIVLCFVGLMFPQQGMWPLRLKVFPILQVDVCGRCSLGAAFRTEPRIP